MALVDGLQAYWNFDESSGNAIDSVASLTATNNGSTAYASGLINNGADLEASSSNYFTVADTAAVRVDDGWSFSMWFKPESVTNFQVLWRQRSGENGISCYMDSTGALTIGAGSGSFTNAAPSTLTITNATWNHVVIYWNGSSTKLYINNSSPETINIPAITPPNSTLFIGRDYAGASFFLDGIIDEFGIWNRELTATDVSNLYNSGAGFAYPFSGGGATFIPRISFIM